MASPIVTLSTDWGESDFFAGKVKGCLYSLIDDVRVVDLTHRLQPFNILTSTFVVRHGCTGFPPGTIHIIDVASRPPFVAVKARGQYFICSDTGLPYMALGEDIEDVVVLHIPEEELDNFPAFSVFAPAAALLARGADLASLGERPQQLLQKTLPSYVRQGDDYRVYVHYIDSYGNAYLGLSLREFEQLRAGRPFVLSVREHEVTELSPTYYHTPPRTDPRYTLRLTPSATGLLELSVREGSLAHLVGLAVSGSVMLRFK